MPGLPHLHGSLQDALVEWRGHGLHVVQHRQYHARPGNAQGLGGHGRRIRRAGQREARALAAPAGVWRGMEVQSRRALPWRQRRLAPSRDQRRHARVGPELGRGRGCRQVSELLSLLSPSHLQSLHARRVPGGMPSPGNREAGIRRHRHRQRGSLPRLPLLSVRLPLQEDLLQSSEEGGSEVHLLLSTD